MQSLVDSAIGQAVSHSMTRANTAAHSLDPAAVGDGRTPPPNDKLWKACKAFESLFVQRMLAEMHKTVPNSGLLGKGFAEGVQSSMMDQAIANAVGKQGRLGIATSMYRQLSQQYEAQEKAQNGDKQASLSGPAPAGGKQGG